MCDSKILRKWKRNEGKTIKKIGKKSKELIWYEKREEAYFFDHSANPPHK